MASSAFSRVGRFATAAVMVGSIGGCTTRAVHASTTASITISSTTARPAVVWTSAGSSVQGRALRVGRVGSGPKKVLWIGGIHGNEPEGTVATAGVADVVSADHALSSRITLVALEDANPDGRQARTRTNANNVDLNRNFPASNFDARDPLFGRTPLSQPESRLIHDLVVAEHPSLVVVCHSWVGDSFVNYDGPAQVFAEALAAGSPLKVKPSAQLGEATPGSLGSWVGHDLGVPTVTVEWRRGSDSASDWATSRDGIIAMLRRT